MIVCPNKECQNYGQELEDNMEVCPLCGTKTENSKSKKGSSSSANLAIICCLAAVIGVILFWSPIGWITYISGPIIVAASVVGAFISKKTYAIVITILGVLTVIGLFIAIATGLLIW